ncbi:MAG: peptide-N-glycosidase F-related protein [Bacteroidota bacterium]
MRPHLRPPLASFGILFLFSLVFFAASPAKAANGDTTRVMTWVNDEYTWPVTHVETFAGFPDSTKRFRKIIMRYTLGCASGGCDPWDVGAPLYIDRPLDGGGFETIEIARFITPYSKAGVWEWDVTDYQSLLRDSVTLRHRNASYTSGPQGYTVTLEFVFIEGTPPRYPYKVERLWQGGYAYGVNTITTTDYLALDTSINGDTLYDYQWDQFIVYDSVISFDSTIVGSGASNSTEILGASRPDARSQMLWTASELSSAGLNSGDISGLRLNALTVGSPLRDLKIRMRHTNLAALSTSAYENAGFTLVYDQNTLLSAGWNKLAFTAPFVWNGTDNVLIDISYDNSTPGTDNVLQADAAPFTALVGNRDLDHYLEYQDTNRVLAPGAALSTIDSVVTVSFWQYGDFDEQPQNDICFEALDASGNRVLNVHLPWGNGRIYWDAGNDGGNYDRIDDQATPEIYQATWTHWAFVKDARTGEMTIYANGQPWFSGTGRTRNMTGITTLRLGSNGVGTANYYGGKMDEFRVWRAALDSATINEWMHRKVNPNHPHYADLLLNYEFNEGNGMTIGDTPGTNDGMVEGTADWEGHQRVVPAQRHPDQFTRNLRPYVIFEQGQYVSHLDSVVSDSAISYSIQTSIFHNAFDSTVKALPITIDPNADQVKLHIRTSGHGFGGNLNCAEFCRRWHSIYVDGQQALNWQVWNDKCDVNACYPQGGTWIYDRAGWCPGSFTLEQDLELTSLVTPGQTHSIDYECEPYTWNNQGSRPTWDLANHLISYEAPAHTLDASIDDVLSPNNRREEYGRMNPICGRPKIVIQNTGTDVLTSLDIKYNAGGADSLFTWTGNLSFMETEEVELGFVDWSAATDLFKVWVENPNGAADQYAINDTFYTRFDQPDLYRENIFLQWRTNNAVSETKYQLMDADENILYQNSPFLTANTLYRDTFQLSPGCYIFRLWDTGEDGLSFFANNDGAGYARLRDVATGSILHIFNADFGGELRLQFNVTDQVSITPQALTGVEVYPNPSQGRLNVDLELPYPQDADIEVYTLLGQRVLTKHLSEVTQQVEVLDLDDQPNGLYVVEVRTREGKFTRKVQLQR